MKRLAVLAALGVLLSSVGVASTGGAQDAGISLTITDVYTDDYPADPNPITVCPNDLGPQVMEAGDQFTIDGPPGVYKVEVFASGSASCSDVPEQTYETSIYSGEDLGLVVGENLMYTFPYDDTCVAAGQARALVASGLILGIDVYLISPTDLTTTPLATGLAPAGWSSAEVPAGTYNVAVVQAGADPNGPRLATVLNVDLGVGTATQIFLAGGVSGDDAGGFLSQQDPGVCDDAEPPEETTSTSTTSTSAPTSTTTTTSSVAPAAASPATPVSGTADYTG